MTTFATLTDIFGNCTAEQVFLLGQVACAHSNRKFTRAKAKNAVKAYSEAAGMHRSFGMFSDCGSYYEERKAVAQAELDAAASTKRSAEKYYKKLCHEYLENDGKPEVMVALVRLLQKDEETRVFSPHSQ